MMMFFLSDITPITLTEIFDAGACCRPEKGYESIFLDFELLKALVEEFLGSAVLGFWG